MNSSLRETIQQFLQQYAIPTQACFLIAVSGGADSIALLHAFKYLNLPVTALHCNFKLRGKESDRDEQFVKRFCDTYGIPLHVKKFETRSYALEKGISIEMAARELRYRWFAEMKEKKRMDYVVVAHHADDLAETVLINWCRGTGIRGLTGIKPVSGFILRPLLSCSHQEILDYIAGHQLGYRTDSTNNSLDYVRNKIRHLILPVCKDINPSFLATVAENCAALKETEAVFNYGIQQLQTQLVERKEDELLIHIQRTLTCPAPYTFLFEILYPYGFNKSQVQDILSSSAAIPGKQFYAGNYVLTRGRTYWRLFIEPPVYPALTIPAPGRYEIQEKNYEFSLFPRPADYQIPATPQIACLDADKIRFPLEVRNWQAGDYFCPIGMKKSRKKLSDFFTDQKLTAKQKKECLILTSEGKVVWIIGYRLDDRYKITSLTHNILTIKTL